MSHMKPMAGKVKRSMPRNFKNQGPKAMGTTIAMPTKGEAEPGMRSKVLPNTMKAPAKAGTPKNGRGVPGIRARDHAEEMGKI